MAERKALTASGGNDTLIRCRISPDCCASYTQEFPLQVEFVGDVRVDPIGVDLPPKNTQITPRVSFTPSSSDTNSKFTLTMVDPDLPWDMGTCLHWLVVNIPSNGNVSEGETIIPYGGPGCPAGSGDHRYVFFVHRQLEVSPITFALPPSRFKFDMSTFIQSKNISPPIAVNFFLASADCSCHPIRSTIMYVIGNLCCCCGFICCRSKKPTAVQRTG